MPLTKEKAVLELEVTAQNQNKAPLQNCWPLQAGWNLRTRCVNNVAKVRCRSEHCLAYKDSIYSEGMKAVASCQGSERIPNDLWQETWARAYSARLDRQRRSVGREGKTNTSAMKNVPGSI
jgi:hypothetical protein